MSQRVRVARCFTTPPVQLFARRVGGQRRPHAFRAWMQEGKTRSRPHVPRVWANGCPVGRSEYQCAVGSAQCAVLSTAPLITAHCPLRTAHCVAFHSLSRLFSESRARVHTHDAATQKPTPNSPAHDAIPHDRGTWGLL